MKASGPQAGMGQPAYCPACFQPFLSSLFPQVGLIPFYIPPPTPPYLTPELLRLRQPGVLFD